MSSLVKQLAVPIAFTGIGLASAQAATNPLAMPQVGDHELRLLDPTLLELTRITTKEPDPAPVTDWNFVGANFAPALPAATQFVVNAGDSTIGVTAVGFKRRPLYAPLRYRDLRIENSIYLRLASPVLEGQTVSVTNPSGELWDGNSTFETVASPLRFNPAIHVNQVGYLPQASKTAMVGYYLGSLGEMPITGTTFNLVDASTGAAVYSGNLTLRADIGFTYTPKPYQEVYQADFSNFQGTGEYMVQVPGMGVSFPFMIDHGSGAAFARASALGLYHQRCGGSNELPYTRHEHSACHIAPVEVPTMDFTRVNYHLSSMSWDYNNNPSHTAPQLKDVNSSLYPFINKGPIDLGGGHHDAGDYSKYTINSAGLIHHLVFAADSLTGVGFLDNLGLPESGDGKSDVLQEAKWEADFLAKMQDADGGFYFLVYPRDRAYEDNVLPDKGDSQVVFPKTTAATAAAVAALAEIGSSPLFKQQFPVEAAQYLQKAQLGWTFLVNAINKHGKDGSYQKITHYGNEFMHDDELAWAAAAMFAATGQPEYQTQLMDWYDPADPNTRRWSWWRLFEGYGNAARTYAFAARSGRLPASQLNATYLALCQAEIIAAGDDIARFAEQTAYGTSFPDPNKSFRNAGWYFSGERAFEMAVAQQLTPKQRYMDAIVSNMNYEGGCNPVNVSYVTGLGWKRWRDIVHQYAQNDYQTLPPSGIPLGNIQGGFPWLENYKQELGALCFPPDGAQSAPYPFYDRWGDTFNTTTEFVVMDQARILGTMAFLMGQTPAAGNPSESKLAEIGGLPATIPAEQFVTATVGVPGADLSFARVTWEAKDQEPFAGHEFTFAPANSGEQWVEVEIQMPDGQRYFGKTVFTASFPETIGGNEFQSAPLAPTSEILALYHLDNQLTDATGTQPALALSGSARLDSMNLGWMADRNGTALRFNDLGDKAAVTLPSLYTAGVTKEITIEGMIFINAYKGYNRGQGRILSLRKGWNASLELMEDTYSGAHLRGGTQFDLFGAALAAALPVQKWHHLSITVDGATYSARVNGKLVGSAPSTELTAWNNGPVSLELGNFDGWLDEIVIRNGRSAIVAKPAIIKPAAPEGLSATALSTSEIRLNWSDASNNEDGFRIYRSVDGLDFYEIGNASSGSVSFTDSGLEGATEYIYEVVSFNDAGESTPVETSATTVAPAPVEPPLTPLSFLVARTGPLEISMGWVDRATNEDGYEVERSTDGVNFTRIAVLPANSDFYRDSGLKASTIYYYRARAFTGSLYSGYSARSHTKTEAVTLSTPGGFLVARTGPFQIDMAWTDRAPNEEGYEIERSTDGVNFARIAVLPANSEFYRDSGLAASTIYYYRARAFTGSLYSGYSARSHTKTEAVTLSTPGGFLVARTGPYQIDMAWTDRAINEQGYEIERSTDGVNFIRLAVLPANTEFYSETGLKASTIYYYRARAFFGDSYSNYSRRSHTRTAP